MSPGRQQGGTPVSLHLDITKQNAIDDNAFQAELTSLIENSVNIHGDAVPGGPLWFGLQENPRSKVRACAKNNKLWQPDALPSAGQTAYPEKDLNHIRNTLKHILVQETKEPLSRVIILGTNWKSDPWLDVDEVDHPAKWDRPVLMVIPDQIQIGTNLNTVLGGWLAKHVLKKRNTVRFLLLETDKEGLYADTELIFSARCSFLCSREAWGMDATYRGLHRDFDGPLRKALKTRFNRFAILRKWDFQSSQECEFDTEKISEQGENIPGTVENKILSDLFDHTDFKTFLLQRAKDADFLGSLMDDLMEPPPPNVGDAIPFLGETKTYEFVIDIAAEGDIVLNVDGNWIGRRAEDSNENDAKSYIRSKAFRTGQEMRRIQLGLPGSVGGKAVSVPKDPSKEATTPSADDTSDEKPYPTGTTNDDGKPLGEGENKEKTDVPDLPGLPNKPLTITQSRKSVEAATGINLSGCFEKWGIDSNKTLSSAKIEFQGLTAQQVKRSVRRYSMKKDLNDYLASPYKIEIVPIAEDEGGGYLARLPQFGVLGIVGDGETKEQALADLARSQKERFQRYLAEGLEIPKPETELGEYSGRFLVRFPKYLHRELSKAAKENGVSLNQYICTLLAMNFQSDRLAATITVMREEIQTLNQNIGTLKYQFKESYRFSKYDISTIHADEYPQAA